MAMDGAVDGCSALYALPLLLEKCFAGTIKTEKKVLRFNKRRIC